MIIIEGPDAAGKSTVVQWIKDNTNFDITKPYYPKTNQLSYYLHSPSYYGGLILERYYLSELVYPRFKNNREAMPDWAQFMIEAGILPYAPVILYVRPSKETIIENLRIRGDDYITEDDVDSMLKEYDWAINRSHIDHVTYDFKNDDIEEKFNLAKDQHESDSFYTGIRRYLSAGNMSTSRGLMFIGDDPSNKSIGEGYIRSFLSDKGSSPFLHKALYEAGIYDREMPYFTNWGKGFDNDDDKMEALKTEIEEINPRKIICLGKEVAEKTGICGGIIEHPSFVKRFHSKDYQWYIDKIKDECNIQLDA